MTVIYEATENRPHLCTTADDGLPEGSICRCDCGRFWLRKTVIGDYWVHRWVPVRWYHRQARRRIKEWVRQKNEADFLFPMTSLLATAPPQTLTNKTIQDYGVNLHPVGEPRLTINGEPLTREAAEMLARLRDTVPGEGWVDGEKAWREADDTTPTRFRVTAKLYRSPFDDESYSEATWQGTRFQIGEMAGEYADESDNPLLHMEIGTVEVLDD